MGNAADDLGEIVDRWAKPAASTAQDAVVSRSEARNLDDPKLWADFSAATRAMAEIEDFIAANPQLAERQSPVVVDLWKHVAQPDRLWGSSSSNSGSGGRTKLDPRTRAGLETLSFAIDAKAPPLPTALTAKDAETLRESLEEIRGCLWGVSDISDEFKEYVDSLITECLDLLDGDLPNMAVLQALGFQVAGAAVSVLPEIPKKNRDKFLDAVGVVGRTFVKSVVTATGVITANAGFQGVVGLLTS